MTCGINGDAIAQPSGTPDFIKLSKFAKFKSSNLHVHVLQTQFIVTCMLVLYDQEII